MKSRTAAPSRRVWVCHRGPVRYAHNDYTDTSAPQRVRDLLPPTEAEARLAELLAVKKNDLHGFSRPVGGVLLRPRLRG